MERMKRMLRKSKQQQDETRTLAGTESGELEADHELSVVGTSALAEQSTENGGTSRVKAAYQMTSSTEADAAQDDFSFEKHVQEERKNQNQNKRKTSEDEDEEDEEVSGSERCGLCWTGHLASSVLLAWVWMLTVPVKVAEFCLVACPLAYLSRLMHERWPVLASSFLVGVALSLGLFVPLSTQADYGRVCTSYLSIVAWFAGHGMVLAAAANGALRLHAVNEGPCGVCRSKEDCSSQTCYWITGLGEAGYVGLTFGLMVAFGDVAFDPNEPEGQWHWCRASDGWPAEIFYLPVFVLACICALVATPEITSVLEARPEDTEDDGVYLEEEPR